MEEKKSFFSTFHEVFIFQIVFNLYAKREKNECQIASQFWTFKQELK